MKLHNKLTKPTIVILATEGLTTNLLYNTLLKHFDVKGVIIEAKIAKKIILKNRVKRVGLLKVFGQVLFMMFVMRLLQKVSSGKISKLLISKGLSFKIYPENLTIKVDSINSENSKQKLQAINPDFVFVNGTRIISKKTLDCVSAKFINIHVGITPKYRGVHGGYWALYNNEPHLFGTTLHYVDSGIDTGQIIAQDITKVAKTDNFATYPIIQFGLGLELLEKSIDSIKTNSCVSIQPLSTESELYYHPTIWQYVMKRISKGVK